jgi:methionyl-tRNA formyltransferase
MQIERMIRAYDPWPVARTTIAGEDLMIWRAEVITDESRDSSAISSAPGAITALKPEAVVKCGRGSLALIEVQAPGRRRMAAAEYLRGRRITAGTRVGT